MRTCAAYDDFGDPVYTAKIVVSYTTGGATTTSKKIGAAKLGAVKL
jgi:hypothetical protein